MKNSNQKGLVRKTSSYEQELADTYAKNHPIAIGNNKVTPKNVLINKNKKKVSPKTAIKAVVKEVIKHIEKPVRQVKVGKVTFLTLEQKIRFIENENIDTISIHQLAHQKIIGVTFNKLVTVGDAIVLEELMYSEANHFRPIGDGQILVVFHINEEELQTTEEAALDAFNRIVGFQTIKGTSAFGGR